MRGLLCGFLFLCSTLVFAAEDEWEFTGKHAPSVYDATISYEEYRELKCQGRLDVLYQSYAEKHPEFSTYHKQPGMREKWLLAMLREHFRKDSEYLNHCVYDEISYELGKFERTESFPKSRIFCGVAARGLKGEERLHVGRLEVLADVAIKGGFSAMRYLITLTDFSPQMRLAPDIRYYFVELLNQEYPNLTVEQSDDGYTFEIPDAETGLSEARLAEIRAAALRNDPSVVINERTKCDPVK